MKIPISKSARVTADANYRSYIRGDSSTDESHTLEITFWLDSDDVTAADELGELADEKILPTRTSKKGSSGIPVQTRNKVGYEKFEAFYNAVEKYIDGNASIELLNVRKYPDDSYPESIYFDFYVREEDNGAALPDKYEIKVRVSAHGEHTMNGENQFMFDSPPDPSERYNFGPISVTQPKDSPKKVRTYGDAMGEVKKFTGYCVTQERKRYEEEAESGKPVTGSFDSWAESELLFDANDVAELLTAVTGKYVELTIGDDGETVTFSVGADVYTVELDGSEESVETSADADDDIEDEYDEDIIEASAHIARRLSPVTACSRGGFRSGNSEIAENPDYNELIFL